MALPAFQLCSIEFYTHVPGDLTAPIFFLNYLFYLGAADLNDLCNRKQPQRRTAGNSGAHAVWSGQLFCGSVPFFPHRPLGFPLHRSGVQRGRRLYLYLHLEGGLCLEVFVFLLLLCGKTSLTVKKRPVRLTGLALAVVLMVTYVTEIKTDWVTEAAGLDTILFTPNVLYRNNGIAGAFLSNLKYIDVEKPEGYSEKAARPLQMSPFRKQRRRKKQRLGRPRQLPQRNSPTSL